MARRKIPANPTTAWWLEKIFVRVGPSRFAVDGAGHVFRYPSGKEVKTGATVDAARRMADNLRAVRAKFEARNGPMRGFNDAAGGN
jgi:hypothetical protein